MNQLQNNSQQNNDLINIRDLFFKYLEKWYWFIISIALCIGAAFLFIKSENPKFQISSTILLRTDDAASGSTQFSLLQSLGVMGGNKLAEEELYIMNSMSTMRQIIETLDLQTEYHKKLGLRYIEQYSTPEITINYPQLFTDTLKCPTTIEIAKRSNNYKVKIKYGKDISASYNITDINTPFNTILGPISITENKTLETSDKFRAITLPMSIRINNLRQMVTATQVKKESNIISINTVSATPKKSIDIISKMIEFYNLDAVIDKNIIATNTRLFIDERLQLITEELATVELDVESYKKKNQLTDISSEAQLLLQTSSEYQKQIAVLETQLNLITYIQEHVKSEQNKYNLIPANLGIEDRSLITLVQEYNAILLERMRLLRTTNTQNPVITQIESQIQLMRENIISSINSLKDGLSISKNDVKKKEMLFETRIKSVPTQERQFLEIKRQQQIKETLYLFLYQKREENALTLASTVQPAKIIDQADYNPTPVSPKKSIIFFLALALGCCLPIGCIFIYDFVNNSIVDYKEYEKLIKAPIIGQVCETKTEERLVVREGQTSTIVELFRLIRTNLNFMLLGKKNPVILITSTFTKEGKSFIAVNLALSFALMKKKVVLIGLDIRNPMLSNYMHLTENGNLTPYLADTSYSTQETIVSSGIHEYLDVIPAGPIPPNPGELIMSQRLDDLIEDLKKYYDYILIDSAPVGMVSDTYLLNRFADATLYVSRAGYTPRSSVEFINNLYGNGRLNNMACILNGVDEKAKFGQKYGYGYGHDKK